MAFQDHDWQSAFADLLQPGQGLAAYSVVLGLVIHRDPPGLGSLFPERGRAQSQS